MILLTIIITIAIIFGILSYTYYRNKWYEKHKKNFYTQRKIYLESIPFIEVKKYKAKTYSLFPDFYSTLTKFWIWDIREFVSNKKLYDKISI